MGQEESSIVDESVAPNTLTARTLEAVAEHIKSGKAKRVVVLTGAGISTAAGIPDFRSPKTGLYSNLKRLNLPYAEAVFDISYFRSHPEPFYVLANELYPGKFHPTISHSFIALLAKKGLLQMLFTQNIDCLERRAGVPADLIVEAHGSFATQRCIECSREFPDEDMKEHVFGGKVPRCSHCGGYVKPDIVFFGEQLPKAFGEKSYLTAMADLVIILGTSLTVYPFAGVPELAKAGTPRLLFNLERVGQIGTRPDDVLHLGQCDAGVRQLAEALGWEKELEKFWIDLVGEEEAKRQRQGSKAQEEEIEDEVERLANEVGEALNFDQDDAEDNNPREAGAAEEEKAAEPASGTKSAPADKTTDTDEDKDVKEQSSAGDETKAAESQTEAASESRPHDTSSSTEPDPTTEPEKTSTGEEKSVL